MAEIYGIMMGEGRVFLIKGQKDCVLVDAGSKGKEQIFFGHLNRLGISPEDIKLIIITHVHYDHVGSLAAIKGMCKCPVAVHTSEASLLEEGIIATPPPATALGRLLSFVGLKLISIDRSFVPVKPDILISEALMLSDYGIDGSVHFTPGHTRGSVSVLLKSGEAFIGDLAVNAFLTVFPIFAEDAKEVLRSWKKIIELGARKIYPSHGPWPFGIEKLAREYEKRTKQIPGAG